MNLKQIVSDGFSMKDIERRYSSFAFISLKTALYSYFSTYESSTLFIHRILNGNSSYVGKDTDRQYSTDYIEKYAETIIHFQHFIELVCKEILREENELLVLNIDKQHELFYKLLNKEEVTSSELEGIRTTEFNSTFDRLLGLIKAGKLDSKYNFFTSKKNKEALTQLNQLRNRIWHRGTFVLRYEALDIFIGQYILPIIKEIISLPEYIDTKSRWIYPPLELGIDPISELINESSTNSYNAGKFAFIKELGRASYNNPLIHNWNIFNKDIIKNAVNTAQAELNYQSQGTTIYYCPVCGVQSLTSYEDSDGEQEADGSYSSYWTFSWYVKCHCCSFKISRELKNPKEYGYALPDYWYSYNH
ncbi:hypothetical protein [Niallia sp. FSL R7-0271]|uniref:hypothetical protein n=1 Tax=Niallia sp. FSL R7-0271 TaxID=2921678 RepID=UPI0030F617A8